MILVGIDVGKDNHDCFNQTADGKVLYKAFSFANNYESFEELYTKILSCYDATVRVRLEATGHYSYNLVVFYSAKNFPPSFSIPYRSINSVKVFLCAKPKPTRSTPELLP